VVGLVGLVPDPENGGRLGFAAEGDAVALVGPFAPDLAASELAKLRGEALPDGLAAVDAAAVRSAQEAVRDAVRGGSLASAHDIAEGGLAVALAECCLAGGIGAEVALEPEGDALGTLFGEGVGGFVVSGGGDALAALARRAPVMRLGRVGGDALRIFDGESSFELGLDGLREAHSALGTLFP
jgi:phosphoribosylformylglycinamidine (FGAM) synthase-like enzyme